MKDSPVKEICGEGEYGISDTQTTNDEEKQ